MHLTICSTQRPFSINVTYIDEGGKRRGRIGEFRADRSVYWRHRQRWPGCHFKYQAASSTGITCWLHFLPQGNYRHRAGSHRNSPRKNFFNDPTTESLLNLNPSIPLSSPLFLPSSPIFSSPLPPSQLQHPPFKTPFSFHSPAKTREAIFPSHFIPSKRRKLHAPCKPCIINFPLATS